MKMRSIGTVVLAAAVSVTVWADLQNVQIGGEIRIRGRYWDNVWSGGGMWANYVPGVAISGRPVGDTQFPARGGIWSRFDWDSRGPDQRYVEELSAIDIMADFTDNVAVVTRLESYDVWGEDFRSNYLTGADMRAWTGDDVEFTQAYVEVKQLFDWPVSVRIGRQLMKFGKGWLVAETHSQSRSQPFDGIRLTYAKDSLTIDAWWAKLADNSPAEEDGDIDFYGIYSTYVVNKALSVSAYWMWIRDAIELHDQASPPVLEWIEELAGVDDYDPTNLHTLGIRVFGKSSGFDYDLEAAYQLGNADAPGHLFRRGAGRYGDNNADYSSLGADFEAGYTFADARWKPRVFLGGMYLGGEDNRRVDFWRWLNPFDKSRASVSFDRLFSMVGIAEIFDSNLLFSNLWQVRAGVDVQPTEKISGQFRLQYLAAVDTFDHPAWFRFAGNVYPIFPGLGFWTEESDAELGWITTLKMKYAYSKEFSVTVGWDHLFTGEGMSDGNYSYLMGYSNTMGSGNDDANYFYFDARLKF